MKRKHIYIFLTALLAFTSACTDYLKEDNKSSVDNQDFYSTASGYKTLITASYARLRDIYGSTPYLDLCGTDLYMEGKREDQTDLIALTRYLTLGNTEKNVDSFYVHCYRAIQTTNAALYYNDFPTDLSKEDRTHYKGEMQFLRAFYHFILLEQFGGIVINDEYTTTPRISIPRSSLEESYTFVISEMEEALSEVADDPGAGRVNKDVVYHYLAKVYLTRGWDLGSDDDFTTAKSYADSVINDKGDITIPYNELWDEDGENNDEFIFSVQYSLGAVADEKKGGNSQSSLYSSYGGSAGLGQKRRSETCIPSFEFHNSFQQNDARYDYDFMWQTPKDYFTYWGADGDTKIIYYNPRIWDPNKTEATAEDTATWENEVGSGNMDAAFLLYPLWRNNKENYVKLAYGGNSGRLPSCKKFDCPENGVNCTLEYNASVRDIVLARLAGTYFLKAEACIALGQIDDAKDLVQKVIDRPGNKLSASGDDITNALSGATDKTSALEALFLEKGKEMFGEYDGRWAMLRRTKMLKYMLEKYNADFETNNITFQDYWNLRPIPQDAITLNSALTSADQNPGY